MTRDAFGSATGGRQRVIRHNQPIVRPSHDSEDDSQENSDSFTKSFRVELASTGRAVCKATDCKVQVIKIQKGELRQGTWVIIKEHGGWQWRHW